VEGGANARVVTLPQAPTGLHFATLSSGSIYSCFGLLSEPVTGLRLTINNFKGFATRLLAPKFPKVRDLLRKELTHHLRCVRSSVDVRSLSPRSRCRPTGPW